LFRYSLTTPPYPHTSPPTHPTPQDESEASFEQDFSGVLALSHAVGRNASLSVLGISDENSTGVSMFDTLEELGQDIVELCSSKGITVVSSRRKAVRVS
jgi:hypothetical protein